MGCGCAAGSVAGSSELAPPLLPLSLTLGHLGFRALHRQRVPPMILVWIGQAICTPVAFLATAIAHTRLPPRLHLHRELCIHSLISTICLSTLSRSFCWGFTSPFIYAGLSSFSGSDSTLEKHIFSLSTLWLQYKHGTFSAFQLIAILNIASQIESLVQRGGIPQLQVAMHLFIPQPIDEGPIKLRSGKGAKCPQPHL